MPSQWWPLAAAAAGTAALLWCLVCLLARTWPAATRTVRAPRPVPTPPTPDGAPRVDPPTVPLRPPAVEL
ncbi:hypothetical protein [Parafrankia soli]|uniref:hypothetical protein n=1 Tax=Parafrankia soli TaxID=2599596 RepID=UPI00104208D3|nr:hypothetical protein [Parafrankia soli]